MVDRCMLIKPVNRGVGRMHRIELAVDRRSGAREMTDLVHLDIEGKRDVVAAQTRSASWRAYPRCSPWCPCKGGRRVGNHTDIT